jgi:hypothetical protein
MNWSKSPKSFFLSSLSLTAAATVQLVLDFARPIPVDLVDHYREGWLINVAGGILFALTITGLLAFVVGLVSALRKNTTRY